LPARSRAKRAERVIPEAEGYPVSRGSQVIIMLKKKGFNYYFQQKNNKELLFFYFRKILSSKNK
jgi:hypothetical protein